MNKRILVAYATGSGSNAEVAKVVGSALRNSEVAVDTTSLEPYTAFIAGSSFRAVDNRS